MAKTNLYWAAMGTATSEVTGLTAWSTRGTAPAALAANTCAFTLSEAVPPECYLITNKFSVH